MNSHLEEDNLFRRYLLNDVTPDEGRRVEDVLLGGEEISSEEDLDSIDRLLLAEDELIDDYACDVLSPRERELLEKNFLNGERRQKLSIAQGLVSYAVAENRAELNEQADSAASNVENLSPSGKQLSQAEGINDVYRATSTEWWRAIFTPGWKVALYAAVILGVGLGIWQMRSAESDIATAMNALNQVYRSQRPLEARITGLDYAPFPKTMGAEQKVSDYVALDRAERILIDAVAQHPTAEAQHALGRLYLARKKFDQAEKIFNAALQSDPNRARLHSDLGAVLFEKWDRVHSAGQTAESEELKRQSLEHLEKALALDGSLREARFNLALLYQTSNQTQLARTEWEKYLASEPDLRAKREAERNLELLK